MQKTNYLTQEIADALGFEIVTSQKMFHPVINIMFYDEAGLFRDSILLDDFFRNIKDWIENGKGNGAALMQLCNCGKMTICNNLCEDRIK